MSAHVYLLATLDTKGIEAAFVRDRLRSLGIRVKLVDTGSRGPPGATADVTREVLFAAADTTAEAVRAIGDRGEAVARAAYGAAKFIREQHAAGDVMGVLG